MDGNAPMSATMCESGSGVKDFSSPKSTDLSNHGTRHNKHTPADLLMLVFIHTIPTRPYQMSIATHTSIVALEYLTQVNEDLRDRHLQHESLMATITR